MEQLVNYCLKFMAQHLEEILVLPVDLSCICDHLVAKVSDATRRDATSLVRND